MPYKDINNQPLAPAQNPYVASGNSTSIIEPNYVIPIVRTRFVNELIKEVQQSLNIRRPIKMFIVGNNGYGKTTLLNLIAKEFHACQGICVPIKFQEIVTPVAASSQPEKHFESLLGAILYKMYKVLLREGVLTKQDEVLFDKIEYIDLFDAFFQMLDRAQRYYILIAFDEVEAIFSSLRLEIPYFLSFLHSLSEKFLSRPGWGLCVSVTQEYYSQIIQQGRQLQEARFNFKIINPLSIPEVKEYIETKNISVTLKVTDKIYPFEDELIDFVAVVSGGIPRYVETICHLLWAEAEPSNPLVSIQSARRIFSNSYRVYARSHLSELRSNFEFSTEAEAFLNLLFFSGGRRQSIQELLSLKDSCGIPYFYQLSNTQAESRLRKAGAELSNKLSEEYLEVFGQKPCRYTLTNSVFKDIFHSREII